MKIVNVPGFADYLKSKTKKTCIILHGTGSGPGAEGDYNWWKQDGKTALSTPFIIERDGTVYQLFDPSYDSYHTGVNPCNRRAIGIEIDCWNQVTCRNGKFYTWTGKELDPSVVVKTRPWKGYEYFEMPTDKQKAAVKELVVDLCRKFGIQFVYSNQPVDPKKFVGITTHSCIHNGKYDFNPEIKLL